MESSFKDIVSNGLDGRWINSSGQSITLFGNVVSIDDCGEIIGIHDIFIKQ